MRVETLFFTKVWAVSDRNHRLDLASAGLGVVTLFLAISLATFDRPTPPRTMSILPMPSFKMAVDGSARLSHLGWLRFWASPRSGWWGSRSWDVSP